MSVENSSERIQKVLAQEGFGSRREIESWITEGRILVNGEVAKLGDRIKLSDKIKLDGRLLRLLKTTKQTIRVIAYHKPAGEVCSRKDEKGRKTVFDHLPRLNRGRWISVGRLDINTFGLLLFTNYGELAHRLMHPSTGIDREYAVRVIGQVEKEKLEHMLKGVELEDGLARFTDIVDSGGEGVNHWYHVALMEGRNREVKRLWESQGIKVSRLIRVRFGPIILLRRSRPGSVRELEQDEIKELMQWTGIEVDQKIKSKKKKRKTSTKRTSRKE